MSDATLTSKTRNRLIPVIAGIAIQLCLGTAYIWGIFQVEVINQFGWLPSTASLPFSLLIFFMSVGSVIGGRLQDKFGPGPVILAGGFVLGTGFILASFTTADKPWWLWLTYGVIGGIGMGTTYTTTIACSQKWFPDKRGLISGCIVSALGFGGIVFTNVANPLIKARGVLETFIWLGVIFIVVCTVGSRFISNPPEGFLPKGFVPKINVAKSVAENYSPTQMMRTPRFWIVTLVLTLACASGFMVIPFAKTIAIDGGIPLETAAVGVMVISFFNSFGRLFWGWVSDKLGRRNTVFLLMLVTGTVIPFVIVAQSYAVFAVIAVVGLCYGGFLGVFPSLTADLFGMKNAGANYGIVLLGFGAGSILFTFVAGYFRDIGSVSTAFYIASAVSFAGALLLLLLNLSLRKSSKKAIEQANS